jgi:hypothetical protein
MPSLGGKLRKSMARAARARSSGFTFSTLSLYVVFPRFIFLFSSVGLALFFSQFYFNSFYFFLILFQFILFFERPQV